MNTRIARPAIVGWAALQPTLFKTKCRLDVWAPWLTLSWLFAAPVVGCGVAHPTMLRHRAQVIRLAEGYAVVAENQIGGGNVEIEVGQDEIR